MSHKEILLSLCKEKKELLFTVLLFLFLFFVCFLLLHFYILTCEILSAAMKDAIQILPLLKMNKYYYYYMGLRRDLSRLKCDKISRSRGKAVSQYCHDEV